MVPLVTAEPPLVTDLTPVDAAALDALAILGDEWAASLKTDATPEEVAAVWTRWLACGEPADVREALEARDWSRATPRPPAPDGAAFARLRAAVGAALGLGYVPTLKCDCPGRASLIRIDDGTASQDDRETFDVVAGGSYFRHVSTRDLLLAVARAAK